MRDQKEESDRLAGVLYTKGLTQEQVSDVFGQIYGHHDLSIKRLCDNPDYKAYLTCLNYAPAIQGVIYTANWIERLN